MTTETDEVGLRLEALRLANQEYGHLETELIVGRAAEFLEFLLAGTEEYGADYTHVPNGEPAILRIDLGLNALMNLSVLLAAAMAFGKEKAIPEDNTLFLFADDLLREIHNTLDTYQEGALD